jgi:hypothetical protein
MIYDFKFQSILFEITHIICEIQVNNTLHSFDNEVVYSRHEFSVQGTICMYAHTVLK